MCGKYMKILSLFLAIFYLKLYGRFAYILLAIFFFSQKNSNFMAHSKFKSFILNIVALSLKYISVFLHFLLMKFMK